MEERSTYCLPCQLLRGAALLALGGWSVFRGAPNIRQRVEQLGTQALAEAKHEYASVYVDGSALHVKGVAPNEAARQAAFAAAVAATKQAQGFPGVYAMAVNDITIPETPPPPAAEDCQRSFNETIAGKVIRFETGSARIDAQSNALLDDIVAVAKRCSAYGLEVGGHTDVRGARPMNMKLSQARANAVLEYLAGHEIDRTRLTAVGYGPDRPVDNANTPEALAKNRRIEFTVKTTK